MITVDYQFWEKYIFGIWKPQKCTFLSFGYWHFAAFHFVSRIKFWEGLEQFKIIYWCLESTKMYFSFGIFLLTTVLILCSINKVCNSSKLSNCDYQLWGKYIFGIWKPWKCTFVPFHYWHSAAFQFVTRIKLREGLEQFKVI